MSTIKSKRKEKGRKPIASKDSDFLIIFDIGYKWSNNDILEYVLSDTMDQENK